MAGAEPLRAVPIVVVVDFYFSRPLGHYGSGRNAGTLRASAPPYKVTKPDALKLGRAVEDSLSGTVIGDDSQVVEIQARKHYGEPPRAEISVYEITDTPTPSTERTLP